MSESDGRGCRWGGNGGSEVSMELGDARVSQDEELWCSHFGKKANRREGWTLGKDRHLQK